MTDEKIDEVLVAASVSAVSVTQNEKDLPSSTSGESSGGRRTSIGDKKNSVFQCHVSLENSIFNAQDFT